MKSHSLSCVIFTLAVLSVNLVSSYIHKDTLSFSLQQHNKRKYFVTLLLAKSEGTNIQPVQTSNQKQQETSLSSINALESSTPELNALLNNMPLADKYSILIESYAKDLSQSFPKKSENFALIESLYSEMIEKSIAPTEKATFSFLNAASLFCNPAQLGQSIQLIKSGTYSYKFHVFTTIMNTIVNII